MHKDLRKVIRSAETETSAVLESTREDADTYINTFLNDEIRALAQEVEDKRQESSRKDDKICELAKLSELREQQVKDQQSTYENKMAELTRHNKELKAASSKQEADHAEEIANYIETLRILRDNHDVDMKAFQETQFTVQSLNSDVEDLRRQLKLERQHPQKLLERKDVAKVAA